MKLLLARHGNTFAAGQTPYIVGRGEDLPLTSEGEAQGARLAALLRDEALIPARILCGELQRTRRMAAIVADALAAPAPTVDARLTELDYGTWSGLTSDEVRMRFGADEADAWDRRGIMPEGRGWHPMAGELTQAAFSFAAEATHEDGITLAVSSNGVLRFFATLVDGLFDALGEAGQLKVGTGNLCAFDYDGTNWRMLFWNRKP